MPHLVYADSHSAFCYHLSIGIMPTPKPLHWKQQLTATEKMDAARAATLEARTRDLVAAGIYARLWPSWMAPTKGKGGNPDAMFPLALHIDSPAGRLSYRLAEGDMPVFEHVTERRREPERVQCTQADKTARLFHLATEGWDEK